MSPWGWKPEAQLGIWRHGAGWLRPVVAAAPYLSVLVCLMMLHFVSGTMMRDCGLVFELPDAAVGESELTGMVALVVPTGDDTMVFFDDSRYLVSDASWKESFADHLSGQVGRREAKSLMVLVDRRVTTEVLMSVAALAKRSGVTKVLFAEKRSGESR